MRDDFTDELISAHLDGELSEDERVRAERLLRDSAEHRKLRDDFRGIGDQVQVLPEFTLPDDFSEQVLRAVSRRDDVQPATETAAARKSGGLRPWRPVALVAAAIAALVMLAVLIPREREPLPITQRHEPVERQDARPRTSDPAGEDERTAGVSNSVVARREAAGEGGRTVEDGGESRIAGTTKNGPSREASVKAGNDRDVRRSDGSTHPDTAPAGESVARAMAGDAQRDTELSEYLLVIDVTLTAKGLQGRAFDRALRQAEIHIDSAIGVDKQLEQALLASRFIDKSLAPPADDGGELNDDAGKLHDGADAPLQLLYVVATGGQIDATISNLLGRREEVASVQFDLALRPSDAELFRQLQRASQAQLAVATTDSAAGRAQRLAMPVSLRGWLAQNFLYLSYVPQGGGPPPPDALPPEALPPEAEANVPPPAGMDFGFDREFSVLAVVHTARE